MKKTHYYLVDTSVIIPGAAVSELEFKIIHEDQPFMVKDLKVKLDSSRIQVSLVQSLWMILVLCLKLFSDHPITSVAWK